MPRVPRWMQLARDPGYHVLSRGHNRKKGKKGNGTDIILKSLPPFGLGLRLAALAAAGSSSAGAS